MERTVGFLERSSRPLRPTRPTFACSLVRPGGSQPHEPVDDTMSGVPTTEKCLVPRVVMRCPLLRMRGLYLGRGDSLRAHQTPHHWSNSTNPVRWCFHFDIGFLPAYPTCFI
ncbi:hypothetical protein KQX54_019687 [Cotesia glomerata]|uniref:Uncharacterized protein n=1 Tax=Cotesia glomerata TaxID=32391 RepID=A0AAV7J9G7_COTGL|nr:hypothetical protein KQX54_019687 [Cotesia glomerata]